jgi:hypothetical protein
VSLDAVRVTLERIGAALSSGDAAEVAGLWEIPGLVIADAGGKAVAHRDEVESFFEQAILWYRDKGTPTAVAEVTNMMPISDRLVAVDVTWRGLDTEGVEMSRELSHYIMRSGDDGVARVQVAMSRSRTA